MLPANLLLSLILHVIIVKGLEAWLGNGFREESGGFLGDRSPLVF